jgi:hypothetical protein
MFWRKKRPVTHELALWLLVSGSLIAGIAVVGYMRTLAEYGKVPVVYPPKTPAVLELMPSLFGTVTSITADGTVTVDTKQAFTTVQFDESTDLASLGGRTLRFDELRVGAKISATGKFGGDGRLLAHAVVVLENGPEAR